MPIKLTQSHHALSLQNGYHLQNNYAAAMTNGSTTYLHQQNRLTVLQLQLKNAFTNGQQDMAIAVNGSRPVSYIGHVVGNGTLTTIFVGRGSTEPASCCYRTIALSAYACSSSSSPSLTTLQWLDTDCVTFVTSATGGGWFWCDVLVRHWRDFLCPLFSPPLLSLLCIRVL